MFFIFQKRKNSKKIFEMDVSYLQKQAQMKIIDLQQLLRYFNILQT